MELGITSFAETIPGPSSAETVSHGERLRQVLEEIEVAESVGLDVYGLGEHHRPDFASSSPATVLAAAAGRTSKIRLFPAVSILSTDDPVRVFQQYATLDLVSSGRAELLVGRGSFIESFPLFGYALDDYDDLFAEKLDLLLQIRDDEQVTWTGRSDHPSKGRASIPGPNDRFPSGWRWVGHPSRSSEPLPGGYRWPWRSSEELLTGFGPWPICTGARSSNPDLTRPRFLYRSTATDTSPTPPNKLPTSSTSPTQLP